MVKRSTSVGLVLALALAACTGAGEKPPTGSVVVRDSAGIQIVEHPAGYETTLPTWTVESSPQVDIGAGNGPGHDLDLVWGAVRLSDGRIVVLNSGTSELRFYDSTGKYLSASGRKGNGPGEFVFPALVDRMAGDTLVVLDGQLGRWSLLAPSGRFVRSTTVIRRSERSYVIGSARLSDGRWVAWEYPMREYRETSGPVRRDSFVLVVIGADGTGLDSLVVLPGAEMYPAVGYEGGHEFPTIKSLEFGRETVTVTDGERIFVGSNEPMGIRVFDPSGRLLRAIRSATPPEPVTEEHRKRRAEENVAHLSRQRASEQIKAEWIKNAENARYAKVFPQYERLLVGTDGSLWLERPRRYEDEGRRYVVYDSAGRAIATVNCPERVRPYVVGPDRIIGLWRDPDQVHHVRAYRVSAKR